LPRRVLEETASGELSAAGYISDGKVSPWSSILKDAQRAVSTYSRLLKLNPDAEEFSLVQAPVSSSDTEIAVLTRSIVSIMQNMAAEVEVPAEDLAKNYAFPGYEGRDQGIGDNARMIRIHSGKQKSAEGFVAVKYEVLVLIDKAIFTQNWCSCSS
jgi:hypothetical protein